MRAIDFTIFLSHPSLAFVLVCAFGVIVFVLPHLSIWRWRKQTARMEKWVAENPIADETTMRNCCAFCEETRTLKIIADVLPAEMYRTPLSVKKCGQVTYFELRCARCGRQVGRKVDTLRL